jgi:tetratricopeptide (TPR) repeat protein/uncharacterized membrane protein
MEKPSTRKNAARGGVPAKATAKIVSAPTLPAWLNREALWGVLLVLAVVLAYQPVWTAGFIWDDNIQLTDNPCIAGPLGLKEIWTTSDSGYYPLVLTSFWVEHKLWGFAPLPYHLVNVLMHGLCAVLLWRVLRRLHIPGAWLGAALWALHPVQVETAAWITELKNTQSGLFYLLTILFYIDGLKAPASQSEKPRRWNYTLTLLFAAMAMASKPSTIVLPIVLALAAWWMEGRWSWLRVAKLWPFALMTVFSSLLTLWTQQVQGAGDLQWARSLPQRVATTGDVVWFYLGKLAWPHPLIFIYPRWEIDAGQWTAWLPLLTLLALLIFLWTRRSTAWGRPCFFALAYFIASLLPVLGLIDGFFWRYSLVGDHFQYLASMGPLALAGAALARLGNLVLPGKIAIQRALAAASLLLLGMLSWQQAWVYQDLKTLWTDTETQNPGAWIAWNNLGDALVNEGRLDEAMPQFQKAVAIYPGYCEAHNNIGNLLSQAGHYDAAIPQYEQALASNPRYAEAYNGLGNALQQKGRLDEAIAQYQQSLALNPYYAAAYSNLGNALLQKNQVDDAIAVLQKALANNPNLSQSHYNLGWAYLHQGRVNDTIAQYRIALALDPDSPNILYNLGNLLLIKGQNDEAIALFQRAIELNPNYVQARNNLGAALMRKGQINAAVAQFEEAVRLDPNDAEAHNNLGGVYLHQRQPDAAIAEYMTALKINPGYVDVHANLGLAYIQKGQLDAAVAQFQEVVRLKPGDPNARALLAQAQALAKQKTLKK